MMIITTAKAAYGDIHGSVCLLYEQGTSRGICGRLVMGCARLRGRFVTKHSVRMVRSLPAIG